MAELFAGRYQLVDQIGSGGMGLIWRAHDLRTKTFVAAKLLQHSDARMLLRFVHEQSLRVSHPHIVVPLGWAADDNRVLFTMPIISGGSVATLIGDYGALPPRFAAEIMRQLVSALSAVHAAGLVHRDLKPANVLLDATGLGRPHAYLSDFGIAVDLNGPRLTETGMVQGTPGYLAPELASLAEPSPAADAFALGMVGAVMVTGLRPHQIERSGSRPESVPSELWQILVDLTESEPTRRPSLGEVAARLDADCLTWQPGAAEDVEVLCQVPPLPKPTTVPTQAVPGPVAPQPGTSLPTQVIPARTSPLISPPPISPVAVIPQQPRHPHQIQSVAGPVPMSSPAQEPSRRRKFGMADAIVLLVMMGLIIVGSWLLVIGLT